MESLPNLTGSIPAQYENVSLFRPDDQFFIDAAAVIDSNPEKQQVPAFWVDKYEKDRAKNWDTFYKRNKDNFFKDRHYLVREFGLALTDDRTWKFVELGCGVGNALLPLVEGHSTLHGVGIDYSSVAISILNERVVKGELSSRCEGRVADLTDIGTCLDDLEGTADYVSLFFALSACQPESFSNVASVVGKLLKPGGKLLFRDYAKFDLAQLRLAEKQAKLADDFYVRGDGTRAKFFTEQEAHGIFKSLKCNHIGTQAKVFVNRKTGAEMKRLWVQGVWTKQ